MSQLRRARQIERITPTLFSQTVSMLQRHWKKFLAFIGVPTALDILREFGRAKFMDWLYEHLDGLGVWLATYKLSLLTFGMLLGVGWLIVATWTESRKRRESTILDQHGKPYQLPVVSRRWAIIFSLFAATSCILIVYGAYRLYETSDLALLGKFPFGYVIFKADYSGSVFPYQSKELLKNYEFDWRNAGISEITADKITIRMPDIIILPSESIIGNAHIRMQKKVGSEEHYFTDGKISMSAEIIAINRHGVILVIGLRPARKNQAAS